MASITLTIPDSKMAVVQFLANKDEITVTQLCQKELDYYLNVVISDRAGDYLTIDQKTTALTNAFAKIATPPIKAG